MKEAGFVSFANCFSNDVNTFNLELRKCIEEKNFSFEVLGTLNNDLKDEVVLISKKNGDNLPNLLISAGFHGEEPAGVWAILKFLILLNEDDLKNINIAFLPLVNPSGIRANHRYNYLGENPNSNFCHVTDINKKPSEEGRLLLKHLNKLKDLAKDGFISLHEDEDFEEFYLYTFEKSDTPGGFSNMLREAEVKFFKPVPNGNVEKDEVINGIIYKACDGSFEDMMFHHGIPRTACTETPGKLDVNLRIEANLNIIKQSINYVSSISR